MRSSSRSKGGKKPKVHFVCTDCGNDTQKWFGQCPSCQAWATLKEFRVPSDPSEGVRSGTSGSLLRPDAFASAEGKSRGFFESRRGGTPADKSDSPDGSSSSEDAGMDDESGRAGGAEGNRPAGDGAWNDRPATDGGGDAGPDPWRVAGVYRLDQVPLTSVPRLATGIQEFDRILGGGIVPGSVVLIGGDPGIGKSTLMLQIAGRLVEQGINTLYVSGEESATQIRLRAERISGVPDALPVQTETNLESVAAAVAEIDPQVIVIDSIQTAFLPTVNSAPGSVTQVRESALALIELAKSRQIAVLLVGHVTKEGTLAGPRTLEHMVDTVLYMEGERYQHYRILRSAKNRFGSIEEIGVFEMVDSGLREVANPSQLFLSEHTAGAVGSVVTASLEGTRALLMEVQSLVHKTKFAVPQRSTTGYEAKRLAILLAVLSKRCKLDTSQCDVFVNVAGGLRVGEPGVDLGVLLAVASSFGERPPYPDMIVLGEVGLGGEVRRIAHPERRVHEAARLGYRRAVLPAANAADLGGSKHGVELIGVGTVVEALAAGLQSPGA